jgi:hypothetical protein
MKFDASASRAWYEIAPAALMQNEVKLVAVEAAT